MLFTVSKTGIRPNRINKQQARFENDLNKDEPLLSVENLSVKLQKPGTSSFYLNNISFTISSGKTLGLIGGSGSGKTMTALAILGLLPGWCSELKGTLNFAGQSIDFADTQTIVGLRGRHIAMVFQDPLACLNPVIRVGDQIADIVKRHQQLSGSNCKSVVYELLDKVRLGNAKSLYKKYPHQLSGGMAQRILLAMALGCKPAILIADEPTTALDITTQGQILKLLDDLQKQDRFGMLYISHDIRVVKYLADDIVVLYGGEIVESGMTVHVVENPQQEYTKHLLTV